MGISTSDMSAAVTGNNGGFGNDDGAWWIIILFLFALMGNNWENGNGTGGYGYGVQQGFDQAAVMVAICQLLMLTQEETITTDTIIIT